MNKFQNKYRIPSARAPWWNYGWRGAYFITICTKDRQSYFGQIQQGCMILSPIGIIADLLWYQIPFHFKNVELGAFVAMPNHVHGIIIINEYLEDKKLELGSSNDLGVSSVSPLSPLSSVETGHALSQQSQSQSQSQPQPQPQSPAQSRFQNQGKNTVSAIIGSYKSAVTKNAHRLGFGFEWQTRFYDNIIRSDTDFERISKYIEMNPQKWREDKFHI